jgi:hypothetical protein
MWLEEKTKCGLKQCIFVETFQDIGFHTWSVMNFTHPSAIWDISSKSYARATAKNSMPELKLRCLNVYAEILKTHCKILEPYDKPFWEKI